MLGVRGLGLPAVRYQRDLPPRYWGPSGEAVWRRLDHANIFLITAGTYTPLAVLLPRAQQRMPLTVVWPGALAGIAFRLLWIRAPRWLYTPCYVVLGWVAVFNLPDFARTGGTAVVVLVVAGGLLHTAGAVVYALERPDPSPAWFGFHEVFHALTIAAFTAQYTAIILAATPQGGSLTTCLLCMWRPGRAESAAGASVPRPGGYSGGAEGLAPGPQRQGVRHGDTVFGARDRAATC